MAPFAFVSRWFLATARLADQGDGAVQTGEAAGTAAIAGIHIDVDAIGGGLDRLVAGRHLHRAGSRSPAEPDSFLQSAPGSVPDDPAAGRGRRWDRLWRSCRSSCTGRRRDRAPGLPAMGLPSYSSWVAGLSRPARAGLETLATAGAEGEVLGLLDGPRRARFMANHGGLAGSLPTLCQPTEEIVSHARP